MPRAGNLRHDHWTSSELQVIYDLVSELDWFATARLLLPRRSDTAIRVKMSILRFESGIIPGIIGPRSVSTAKAERQRTAQASERLRCAIKEFEPA